MSLGRITHSVAARLSVAVLAAALLCLPGLASAQREIQIIPQFGYLWGGTYDFTGGSVHINAAPEYGGTLAIPTQPGLYVELSYHYQSSDLIARPNGFPNSTLCSISTQYIEISGRRMAPSQGKAAPFVLGGLGMTFYSPGNATFANQNIGLEGQYMLSFNMGGGVQVAMNDKIDLRLQARALIPVMWASGGVYFGSGGGGVSISGGSAILQGDASLGIVIKMGS